MCLLCLNAVLTRELFTVPHQARSVSDDCIITYRTYASRVVWTARNRNYVTVDNLG